MFWLYTSKDEIIDLTKMECFHIEGTRDGQYVLSAESADHAYVIGFYEAKEKAREQLEYIAGILSAKNICIAGKNE